MAVSRLLLEIRPFKVLLARAQREMRNLVLETVPWWQKTAELCPAIIRSTDLVRDELGHLAEEICRQSVEGMA